MLGLLIFVFFFEFFYGFAQRVWDRGTGLGEAAVAGEYGVAGGADVARVGVDNLLDDGDALVANFFGVGGDVDVVVEMNL